MPFTYLARLFIFPVLHRKVYMTDDRLQRIGGSQIKWKELNKGVILNLHKMGGVAEPPINGRTVNSRTNWAIA